MAYQSDGTVEQRLAAIGSVLEKQGDRILSQCDAHEATAGRNHLPFLTAFYSHQRAALFQFLEHVKLVSTSPDTSVTDAIAFVRAHKRERHERVCVRREETHEDGQHTGCDTDQSLLCLGEMVARDDEPERPERGRDGPPPSLRTLCPDGGHARPEVGGFVHPRQCPLQ